jgi:hypothetical protein
MPRAKKPKEPIPLSVPQQNTNVTRWVILGLDPSMSRTGFALLDVRPGLAHTPEEGPYSESAWLAAGSVKPDEIVGIENWHTRNTVWVRAKAMAIYIREIIKSVAPTDGKRDVGLILCLEYPTPTQDYLVALNRILYLIFFEDGVLAKLFGDVRIFMVNASTLRSLMGLTKQGATNKGENILKAYEFIDRQKYPQLDFDSCDAVLLAMMARHAASVMLGVSGEVPERILTSLCRADQEVKGNGRNQHVVTKGLLHRQEYWYRYQPSVATVAVKDASNPKKNLSRVNFSI